MLVFLEWCTFFCILLPFFHCFVMNIHMSQEWDIDVQTASSGDMMNFLVESV